MHKCLGAVIVLVCLTSCPLTLKAQRTTTVEIEYFYCGNRNLTLEQVENMAIQAAKAQAIADEFGTIIVSHISNGFSISQSGEASYFNAMNMSDVRGEWIKTKGKPTVKTTIDDSGYYNVRVHIKGEIREILYAKPQFSCKLLRNGIDDRYESSDFREGDRMVLSFTSPVSGYLAVFAKEGPDVRCFLPVVEDPNGFLKVEGRTRALFFNCENDKLEFYCDDDSEMNAFYTVFSTRPIFRPLANKFDEYGTPLYKDEEFHKWLSSAQSSDKEMQVEVKYITINKH